LGRVERGRAVLQRETQLVQLDLDLVDGLLAEVTDVPHVGLRPRDQLADGVDALALEAVVRPDGEFQIVDRQRERGDVVCLGRRRGALDAPGVCGWAPSPTEPFDKTR